jgi:hypothetical protein
VLNFVKNSYAVFDVFDLLFLFIKQMLKRANKFFGVF